MYINDNEGTNVYNIVNITANIQFIYLFIYDDLTNVFPGVVSRNIQIAVPSPLRNWSNDKIYNGVPALDGEFPYQVSLFSGEYFRCSGTLITERHVLTAAHCFA